MILQNRIEMNVTLSSSYRTTFGPTITRRLRDLYAAQITSAQQLLAMGPNDPRVFCCIIHRYINPDARLPNKAPVKIERYAVIVSIEGDAVSFDHKEFVIR